MTYLPIDKNLKPARQKLPAGACDCHFHIFDEFERFPLDPKRGYTPTVASSADYKALCQAYGIERAVLVHPSVYGPDHASYEHLLKEHGSWMKGVAVTYPSTTDKELERWHALGTRGTRINVLYENAHSTGDIDSILDKVRPFGWHVQVFSDLLRFPDLVTRLVDKGVVVVVDHLGHAPATELVKSAGFADMLSHLRAGRAWVKLSAPYRSSVQQPRYPDVTPVIDAIMRANPAQAVWGTDWPHPIVQPTMPNDGDLVDLVFDWFDDPALRQAVLVDNPTRLYWS